MADNQDNAAEKKSGPGLMGLIKAVVIVAVLVVVEMVGAAMLIPSAEETEKLARDLARAASGEELESEAEERRPDGRRPDEETKSRSNSAPSTSLASTRRPTRRSTSIAWSTGSCSQEEEEEFMEQFAANNSRIHEQIVMTMHAAKTADLASAGLGLIKRQILEKTNRALGRPLLQEVVFTKINFVER